VGRECWRRTVAHHMNSILSLLSCSRLDRIQSATASTQSVYSQSSIQRLGYQRRKVRNDVHMRINPRSVSSWVQRSTCHMVNLSPVQIWVGLITALVHIGPHRGHQTVSGLHSYRTASDHRCDGITLLIQFITGLPNHQQ